MITLNDLSYTAPKPKKSWKTWVWQIACRIIFPPIIVWDIASFLLNRTIGKSMGKLILQAQQSKFAPARLNAMRNAFVGTIDRYSEQTNHFLKNKVLTVKTHDGASLETYQTIYSKYDNHGILITSDNYILNFNGNVGYAEMYSQRILSDAIDMQCNQIYFNYRGVCNSTGYPIKKQDLIIDGIAQVQRLLDAGVHPEKILLKGISLGGAIATQVAEHFHARGIKVYLYNERSFSSITRVLIGYLRFPHSGHRDSLSTRILGICAKPFIRFALSITKWEIDAGTSYSNIPATYKRHMLVRSNKFKRATHIDDTVITHYASLHNDPAVRAQRKKYIARLKSRIEFFAGNEVATAIYVSAVNDVKASKMSHRNFYAEGHSADKKDMTNRFGETGIQHFHRFFNYVKKRTQQTHDNLKATVKVNEVTISTPTRASLSA